MQEDHAQEFDLPDDFNIEEIETFLDEEELEIVHAGNVETWEQLKFSEKVRVRPYITGIVLAVWAICTTASIIRFIMTGDFLFIGSPALLIAPLNTILKFYFRSD